MVHAYHIPRAIEVHSLKYRYSVIYGKNNLFINSCNITVRIDIECNFIHSEPKLVPVVCDSHFSSVLPKNYFLNWLLVTIINTMPRDLLDM